MAVIRAKVVVETVDDMGDNGENVKLRAVYGDTPENKDWSKYTPSAYFQIQISNPGAQGKLIKGQEYYVDFTPASADT